MLNVSFVRALSNVFSSQILCICFIYCIFIAIPDSFAFNSTSLQIISVLLASKIDANANFKLLALATVNANAYKCV